MYTTGIVSRKSNISNVRNFTCSTVRRRYHQNILRRMWLYTVCAPKCHISTYSYNIHIILVRVLCSNTLYNHNISFNDDDNGGVSALTILRCVVRAFSTGNYTSSVLYYRLRWRFGSIPQLRRLQRGEFSGESSGNLHIDTGCVIRFRNIQ